MASILLILSSTAAALAVQSPLVQRLQGGHAITPVVGHAAMPISGRTSSPVMQHSKGWDGFGKGPFKYYSDFNSFMAAFEDEEDRAAYPEMFALPPGVYEVETPRPLGIAFEEIVGGQPKGIKVDYLVDDGNAAQAGKIQPGDILLATTACKEIGPRYERKLLPCIDMEFDIIMGAIGSNEARYRCNGVVMMFMRPAEADEPKVREWLKFFDIPSDHVFRTA